MSPGNSARFSCALESQADHRYHCYYFILQIQAHSIFSSVGCVPESKINSTISSRNISWILMHSLFIVWQNMTKIKNALQRKRTRIHQKYLACVIIIINKHTLDKHAACTTRPQNPFLPVIFLKRCGRFFGCYSRIHGNCGIAQTWCTLHWHRRYASAAFQKQIPRASESFLWMLCARISYKTKRTEAVLIERSRYSPSVQLLSHIPAQPEATVRRLWVCIAHLQSPWPSLQRKAQNTKPIKAAEAREPEAELGVTSPPLSPHLVIFITCFLPPCRVLFRG